MAKYSPAASTIAIVGGGPSGLMAAEVARAAGFVVDVYERKGSVGRKFLIAGKGGLNLTHSENRVDFVKRYSSPDQIAKWLSEFGADEVRQWARELGVETFIGTSGRVFPSDLKAAPLLRAWVRRLRESGVGFHVQHQCLSINAQRQLTFATPQGEHRISADAIVLAMGGGSWPELGSDGEWVNWLRQRDINVAELTPSNCGFEVEWSQVFAQRFAGQPLKSVAVATNNLADKQQGEFVVTSHGVEGSLIYSLSAELRNTLHATGAATIYLDLAPGIELARLQEKLSSRGRRSITEHLRRAVHIDGVKAGLLYEVMSKADMNDANKLAATIKSLPLTLLRPRPVAEAISSAGGVCFESLNDNLMLTALPGVFCAGEMLDWEAPTGGYLLTACFASGKLAGRGATTWLASRS